MDANGVVRTSSADWVSNNTTRSLTFATTELRIEYGAASGGTAGNNSTINHISLNYVPPAQTITSINGGNPITAGQTGITSSSTGFTGLPSTITTDASGATVSGIGGVTNAATFNISDRVDGGLYPKSGTSVNFTFVNGAESDTAAQSVVHKLTETKVVISAPLFTANTLASAILAAFGRTVAVGDEFYHTTYSDLVITTDTDFTVTDAGSFDLWLYVNAGGDAGKNFFYYVTITESGAVVLATGLGRAIQANRLLTKSLNTRSL
jgi:hypothetical protein